MLPSFKMAIQSPLLPRLLCLWSSAYDNIECELFDSYSEQNDSTPMSFTVPSLLRVTISLLNRSTSRIWQIHQFIYRVMLLLLQTYDATIRYQLGKEMLVADALFCYAPLKTPEIPPDITINHAHITPDRKTQFQALIQDDLFLCSIVETSIAGWSDESIMSHILYTHTMATETPSQLKIASSLR